MPFLKIRELLRVRGWLVQSFWRKYFVSRYQKLCAYGCQLFFVKVPDNKIFSASKEVSYLFVKIFVSLCQKKHRRRPCDVCKSLYVIIFTVLETLLQRETKRGKGTLRCVLKKKEKKSLQDSAFRIHPKTCVFTETLLKTVAKHK